MPPHRQGPPPGTIPVTVPGDAVLVRTPSMVVLAGAIMAFRNGFEFTLLTLFDTRRQQAPVDFALQPEDRHRETWLTIRYSDGRSRAADLNVNTPEDLPEGPHLTMQDGVMHSTEGWGAIRWWVSPLPPPGPVELAIHLNGNTRPTGVGRLDGSALARAAALAEVSWPES